jgi:hypothetical protein
MPIRLQPPDEQVVFFHAECWTVYNVGGLDPAMAKRESPTTNRFFQLLAIQTRGTPEYGEFQNRIIALTGIPSI